MDYERVNKASNLISKSPTFRRNIKYNMQQELAEQKYRDYEFEKQNTARANTLSSIQDIEKLARTYSLRDKDRARMEEIYGEAAENFKNIIQTKYGGDITRFWYEGGQAELEGFRKTVLGGEEALRMKKNTEEFAKFFDAIGKKGGMKNVFETTSTQATMYGQGSIDTFKMPIADKLPYEELSQEDYKNARPGTSKVDVILAHGNNEMIFRMNYANEYGMNLEDANKLDYNTVRNYAASYTGGLEGPNSVIQRKDKSLSNSISQVFQNNFGQLDGNKIIDIENRDSIFKEGTNRLQQLAQQSNGDIDAPVYGKLAFENYLPEIISVFVDRGFDPKKKFKEDPVYLDGQKVNHATGTWFGDGGIKMTEGANIEGDDWEILGVTLSYKTVGDEPRLLSKEEVESGSYTGKVEPTYVVNLRDDNFFSSDEYISKELDFNNPLKSASLDSLIKYDDASYQEQLNKDSQTVIDKPVDSFIDIDRGSSSSRLYDYALYNDSAVNKQLSMIGNKAPTYPMKAVLLAFSKIYQQDIDEMHQILSLENAPDLYEAVISNDPQLFIRNLGLLAEQGGVSKEQISQAQKEIEELSKVIRDSVITEQSTK